MSAGEATADAPGPLQRPRPDGSDIRKIGAAEVPAVARSLAQAFYDDPQFAWIVPRDAVRMARLEHGFDTFTRRIWLEHDECYALESLAGAAMWLPPGAWHLGLFEQLALLPAIAATLRRDLPRFLRGLTFIESRHPREPEHWYLPAIGVAPAWQGRGFGAALLRGMLGRFDGEGLPAYLEASTPRSRALYERHGFRVMEECRIAPSAPPLWRMWREPGAGAAHSPAPSFEGA